MNFNNVLTLLKYIFFYRSLFWIPISSYTYISYAQQSKKLRVVNGYKATGEEIHSSSGLTKWNCVNWCAIVNECEAVNFIDNNSCHLLKDVQSLSKEPTSMVLLHKKIFCSGYCSNLPKLCGNCQCVELCSEETPFRCNCSEAIIGQIFSSCADALESNKNQNGLYTIQDAGVTYCSNITKLERIGCFKDSGSSRAFPKWREFDQTEYDSQNPEKMVNLCRDFVFQKSQNILYFGIQYYRECWYGFGDQLKFRRHGKGTGCTDYVGEAGHNMVYKLHRL